MREIDILDASHEQQANPEWLFDRDNVRRKLGRYCFQTNIDIWAIPNSCNEEARRQELRLRILNNVHLPGLFTELAKSTTTAKHQKKVLDILLELTPALPYASPDRPDKLWEGCISYAKRIRENCIDQFIELIGIGVIYCYQVGKPIDNFLMQILIESLKSNTVRVVQRACSVFERVFDFEDARKALALFFEIRSALQNEHKNATKDYHLLQVMTTFLQKYPQVLPYVEPGQTLQVVVQAALGSTYRMKVQGMCVIAALLSNEVGWVVCERPVLEFALSCCELTGFPLRMALLLLRMAAEIGNTDVRNFIASHMDMLPSEIPVESVPDAEQIVAFCT